MILLESGAGPKHLGSSYKKHIRELVEKNIPNIVFVKSKSKNKPQRLVPTLTQVEAARFYQETITDKNYIKSLWKLVRRLRAEVLQSKSRLSANFDCSEYPALLTTFMKWLLLGPCTTENLPDNRTMEIEKLRETSMNFISQDVKTHNRNRNHLEKGSKDFIRRLRSL